MKKISAILLALVIVLSLVLPSASAQEVLTVQVFRGGEAVAKIAQSYYKSGVSFQYNDGDLDFANKGIDCSTYASLCLKGLPYASSPYVGGDYYDSNTSHKWESGLDGKTKADQTVYTTNDKTIQYKGTAVSTKVLSYKKNYLSSLYGYMTKGDLYYSYNIPYNSGTKKIYYLADKNKNEVPFVREYSSYNNGTRYTIKRAADLANYYARNPENTIVYFNPIYYQRTLTRSSSTLLTNTDTKTGRYSSETVKLSNLEPGDLVFWSNPSSPTGASRAKQRTRFMAITHVAIVSLDRAHVYEATTPGTSGSAVKLTSLNGYTDNIVLVIRPKFYKDVWITDAELAQSPLCVSERYADAPGNHYWHISTDWALRGKILIPQRATTLDMKNPCTRAETVLFIWRALGCPAPEGTAFPFRDVSPSDNCYTAVKWAYNATPQVTAGTSPTTFDPDGVCTRAHVMAYLWKALKEPAATANVKFTDVKPGKYYYSAVSWAVKNSITAGTTATTFEPHTKCNRAMIITFLYQAVHLG